MPLSPHPPAEHPIDTGHLRDATLSDPGLQREVLELFATQSTVILRSLGAMPDNASALAHTLKGSARAIGAFGVADAAEKLEDTLRSAGDAPAVLARLEHEVAMAQQAIAGMLQRSEPSTP
jgi:HPt (histidine-containing phosphotransfer) domain-containing protein